MSPNTFWSWHLMAVLLTHGQPARFNKPVGVDHRVKTTMKLPVYPTSMAWSRDLQSGGVSHKVWQQPTPANPDNADRTRKSLVMTSSATVRGETLEELHKPYSGSMSMDTSSFDSTKLNNSFPNLGMNFGKDLATGKKWKNQNTFNLTQIGNIQTQSESVKKDKIPQVQVATENAEFTSVEQVTVDSKRTLLNITDSILTEHNQSYLLPDQHKATEFVLSSPSSRVTADKINIFMGLPGAADLPQEAQDDSYVQAPHFPLAGIVIPYCPAGASCLGRCVEYSFPDVDDEGWIGTSNTKPVTAANFQHKDSSLTMMSDGTNSPVNLSSTAYSNSCPKERFDIHCNCDRTCVVYGDCCPDVFLVCWGLTTSTRRMGSFIKQAWNELLISPYHGNVIDELRRNTSSLQLLDHLYASYGSCEVRDRIYYRRMMFVSRCPDITNTQLKQKCELSDHTSNPPVTAKLGSVAVAFANRFCAVCHGVLQGEYEMWETLLKCDASLRAEWWKVLFIYDVDVLLKYNVCNLTFTDREMACQRRTCMDIEKLTSEQEQQLQVGIVDGACTQTDALMCRSYYFKVGIYINPHCQKCLQHRDRPSKEMRRARPGTTPIPNQGGFKCPIHSHGYKSPPKGIFLILDASESHANNRPSNQSDSHLNTKSSFANCSLSDIFDPVSQACQTRLCPIGQTAERGQCVVSKNPKPSSDSPHQSSETTIKVYIWTYSEQLSCQLFTRKFLEAELPNIRIEHIYIHVYGLRKELIQIIPESNNSRKQSLCEEQDWENPAQNHTAVEIKMILNVDTDLQTWLSVEKIAEHLFPDDYHMTILSSQDYGQFLCASGAEPTNFTSFQIEEENGNLQARVNVQENELYFPLAYVAYKRSFVKVGNATKDLTESISVCEASKLFLKQGCYVISFILNDTLNISQIYRQYGEANVDVQGNQVYVCIQQRFEVVISSDANITIFDIVHWTMAGTSMLCLVVMLSLYYLFPELLTLPGKMTASLAATMLLTLVSISLTLVDFHHRYICPVAGAVSHVLVLAQYGWMSAIAFNMAMTFGPKTLNWAKSLHDKTFLRYNLLVWGISLVLVLISVILDILHEGSAEDEGSNSCSNTTSVQTGSIRSNTSCPSLPKVQNFPRYGWPVCTWFSGPLWTRLAFVVIPYAITFVSNIVWFTITFYGIHRSSKQVQKLGKSSHPRIQCIIYIKLSTAMGFTSAFGVLKTSTHTSDALTYFYMSLILLQGTFLFFGFMTNKRLFSLLKSRFGTREKSLKSSTTVTTMA